MKLKRLLLISLAFLLAISPVQARAQVDTKTIIDGIIAYSTGDFSLQEWVNGPVSASAGSAMDTYVINLNRTGAPIDFSVYIEKAADKLSGGSITNPVSKQRCALALLSCGAKEYVPETLADDTIGKLGVMSYVFGMHLLQNAAYSEIWTTASIADKLIELQKEDGGWAVMGNYGDIDVTAMCLQALSYCPKTDAINASIEAALEFVSVKQLDNGGFSGMGKENAESISQVVIALASLGINAEEDERFCKNGISCVDVLLSYRLPSGGFAHFPGDASANDTASVQALQAVTALSLDGEPYFDFSKAQIREAKPDKAGFSWKNWVYIALGAAAFLGSIYALTRRRGKFKQFVFVVLLAGAAALAVNMINIESASNYYGEHASGDSPEIGNVWLSIRCDTVAGMADDGSTPADGVILERTQLGFSEGDSVFDVLTEAVRRNEIHMEHEGGSEGMAYVNGINYLYEYAYGDLSGWMYYVNGTEPSIGCGSYMVADGDEIVWQYTQKLGEDLK